MHILRNKLFLPSPASQIQYPTLVVLALTFGVLTGCGSNSGFPSSENEAAANLAPQDPELDNPPQTRPGVVEPANRSLPPDVLWAKVMNKFTTANHYRDRAEWNLQYRLQGQLCVETQPVQLQFDRSSNTWSTKAFRSRCFADADYLWVSVNEAATNNLDQQVKVVPAKQWESVFNDPIACLYLSGTTDFPLADRGSDATWSPLFVPHLHWLTGSQEGPVFLRNLHWNDGGSAYFRERKCQILQSGRGSQGFECWIDVASNEIVRLFIPNAILDPRLTQTPDVTDLRMSLDFAEVQWDQVATPDAFDLNPGHKLVKNFVKVPEAFPSPWIGKPTPPIHFQTIKQNSWAIDQHAGRMAVAFFIPVDQDLAGWLQQFQNISGNTNWDSVRWIVSPMTGNPRLPDQLIASLAETPFDIATDGQAAWAQLGLKWQPTMVVWDGHGVVQYAGEIQWDNALEKATKCLQRLRSGDSIALEMTSDYRQFYEGYLNKLESEKANFLPEYQNNRVAQSPSAASKTAGFSRLLAAAATTKEDSNGPGPAAPELDTINLGSDVPSATPKRTTLDSRTFPKELSVLWEHSVQLPQCARWVDGSALDKGQVTELWVLQGYRTLVRFTATGKQLQEISLQLPENVGVSKFVFSASRKAILGYQPGLRQLYEFDVQGKLIAAHQLPHPLQLLVRSTQPERFWLVSDRGAQRVGENSDLNRGMQWNVDHLMQLQPLASETDVRGEKQTTPAIAYGLTQDQLCVQLLEKGTATSNPLQFPEGQNWEPRLVSDASEPTLVLRSTQQNALVLWKPFSPSAARRMPTDALETSTRDTFEVVQWRNQILYHDDHSVRTWRLEGDGVLVPGENWKVPGGTNHLEIHASGLLSVCSGDGKVHVFRMTDRLGAIENLDQR